MTIEGETRSLFPERLRGALRHRRTTLTHLRDELASRGVRVSVSALSQWQTGQRRPEGAASLEALAVIEVCLGLTPGYLVSSLGPSRRPAPGRSEHLDTLVGREAALVAAAEELGVEAPDELEMVHRDSVVDVDGDRMFRRAAIRVLWRARSDGVRRTVISIYLDDPPPDPPAVVAVGGCTVERTLYVPGPNLLAAVLVLPAALDVGETATAEFAYEGPVDVDPLSDWHCLLPRRMSDHLWVRFDADPPTSCEEIVILDGEETRTPIPVRGSTLHHYVRGFGPGVVGLQWWWW